MAEQTGLFRGLYQFEDPSGTLVAARVPPTGATDLYDGTKILVRPNQVAILVHQGKLADLFPSGTHTLTTGNVPVLTKLLNWRHGFKSTVLAEIWFFATQTFLSRRWGTASPVLTEIEGRTMPLRASGTYNLRIKDPRKLFLNVIGSRLCLDISQLEDFIQSRILETLPKALAELRTLSDLGTRQETVGNDLEELLNPELEEFGVVLQDVRVHSVLPPAELLKALDQKLAMDIIGNKQDYLMYQAANGLENLGGAADPVTLMMSLMMGKGLGSGAAVPVPAVAARTASAFCSRCGKPLAAEAQFCSGCGQKAGA